MVAPIRKEETSNVINLSIVNGKLGVKPTVHYNKDGSISKRHPNKVAGVSSEVYPFTTDEEIKAIVDVLNDRIEKAPDGNKRQIACRNKMLFLIGINIGIRASDLVSLKWSFFMKNKDTFKDSYSLQPKKTKKTKKFVTLYFNKVVKKAIADYLEKYPFEDVNEYMFKSRIGDGAITEKALWKIVVDLAADAGIEFNVGSHSLRKTFGYHIWHNSEDKEKALVLLSMIFNHSSIATTKKYIGIMGEEIEDVFQSLNLGMDFME